MEKIAELKQEINLKPKPVKPIQQPVNNETVLSSENQVNNLPQKQLELQEKKQSQDYEIKKEQNALKRGEFSLKALKELR